MLFIICGTDKILVFIYVLSLTCGDKTMFLYLHQLQDWEKCVCVCVVGWRGRGVGGSGSSEASNSLAEVGLNILLHPSCGTIMSH